MSPDTFDAIIAAVRSGEPVRKAIAQSGNSARSFYAILDAEPEQAERYARAKEAQLEALADEMLEIADDEDDPNNKRVRVDVRKWLLSKLAPKKYGERTTSDVNVSGSLTQIIEALPISRRPDKPLAG